jgi:putative mRNA 3-end processing factor
MQLLQPTDRGLYCPPGDFYLDPWQPVSRAVVTHAHSDHARPGSGRYLIPSEGETLVRLRLGADARIDTLDFGDVLEHHGVRVSFHPAGHILGSAQVRLEHRGQVVVYSGDFKLAADPTTRPFEPVRCDLFVTESTFGLPIYRWPTDVFGEINAWWRRNQEQGKASVLYGYAVGKAQRLIAGVDPSIGPIYVHGAIDRFLPAYRDSGVSLPPTTHVAAAAKDTDWSRALIVAPPSAHGTPWLRKFGAISTALASGWMLIRGPRRRRALDRGFAISDHVDWPSLMTAIEATGARTVWVTHGNISVVVRWLRENGYEAEGLATQFVGEEDSDPEAAE